VTSFKDITLHIFFRAFFVVVCAAFSAPIYADDIVSVVEQNYPYQEVDKSYGAAKIVGVRKERRS